MTPSATRDPSSAWAAKARDAAARAERYLRSRQSGNGGFCFYRWMGVDEPTLHDTWHAVATFALLGVEEPRRDEVAAFLRNFRATGFDDLYHQALALDRLGEREPAGPGVLEHIRDLDAVAVLANEHVSVSARLEHALRIIVLQRRFVATDAAAAIIGAVTALRREGGWGDKPNLADTWLALAILDACGVRAFENEVRTFVDTLQVASFGFTATRDSTYAKLDTVHAGVRACGVLGLPMQFVDDAVAFVLSCQTDAGAFAPTSDALPNIGLTHRGVLALAIAGALPMLNIVPAHADTGW